MTVIAHFSDVHLPPLPELPLATLFGKRGLAWLSWRRKRGAYHLPEVISALEADLRATPVDHLVCSGDLINLGLPVEAAAAAEWLARIAPAGNLSLVPGNHDLYRFDSYAATLPWRDYMDEEFPYLHRVGDVAVIGLNTGVPTAPFFATGALGAGQLRALPERLEQARADGLFRLVLLHHPPFPGVRWRKRLTDAPALRALLARYGAELVLHGHLHRPMRHDLRGPNGGVIPVLGCGSASGGTATHWEPGHYQRLGIEGQPGDWRWHAEHRRYDAALGRFAADLTHPQADDKTAFGNDGQP